MSNARKSFVLFSVTYLCLSVANCFQPMPMLMLSSRSLMALSNGGVEASS